MNPERENVFRPRARTNNNGSKNKPMYMKINVAPPPSQENSNQTLMLVCTFNIAFYTFKIYAISQSTKNIRGGDLEIPDLPHTCLSIPM